MGIAPGVAAFLRRFQPLAVYSHSAYPIGALRPNELMLIVRSLTSFTMVCIPLTDFGHCIRLAGDVMRTFPYTQLANNSIHESVETLKAVCVHVQHMQIYKFLR